jgi:Uncharacterized conserved protein
MPPRAAALVSGLGLEPHPEGGFFTRVYESAASCPQPPEGFPADRGAMPFCSSIYYLLAAPDFSAFHRIRSDELWFFHEGTGMAVRILVAGGGYRELLLGPGRAYFGAVEAGSWFAAEPIGPAGALGDAEPPWALVSCAVSPGFDYRDFELADREALARSCPGHAAVIGRLTR